MTDDAPPPYSANDKPSSSLFPQEFGVYHAPGTNSDMKIALSAEAPALYYVSTHRGTFSSQPSVVLHTGPYESASALATADFHPFSSGIDIMLSKRAVKLEREGPFSNITYFVYPIPQANGQVLSERFEWKPSSGPEVQSLQGSSRGMKCVRARSGEVVAAWAAPNVVHRKKGKMRFLLNKDGFGAGKEKFEIMVVISILSIMEKARRGRAGRGAAAAGAGAAAAGGGC